MKRDEREKEREGRGKREKHSKVLLGVLYMKNVNEICTFYYTSCFILFILAGFCMCNLFLVPFPPMIDGDKSSWLLIMLQFT